MAKALNEEKYKNLLFYKIYKLLRNEQSSLPLNEYCLCILPFKGKLIKAKKTDMSAEEKKAIKKTNDRLSTWAFRLLLGDAYWDKNGKLSSSPVAFRNLIGCMNIDEKQIYRLYADNQVCHILGKNSSVAESIMDAVRDSVDDGQIEHVSISALRSSLDTQNYAFFLYMLVKMVFDENFTAEATKQSSDLDDLLKILNVYNVTLHQLLQYTQNTLLRSGMSGTFGDLVILHLAGAPDKIDPNCDPFTLLAASDLYFYHRLNNTDRSSDINNAYKYSKVAYDRWCNPIAAWNMGYTWYLHDSKVLDDTPIHIEEFDEIDDSDEAYLLKAFGYFRESAEHGYADAFNSIGNICKQIREHTDQYTDLFKLILSFTRKMQKQCLKNGEAVKPLVTKQTQDTDIDKCLRFFYERAASLGSYTGMNNYYHLLIKDLTKIINESKNAFGPFTAFHDKTIDITKSISVYIDKLCEYQYPAALTDKARLMLHKHDLNEALNNSRLTLSNKKSISPDSDYDFIYPYAKTSSSRAKAIELLQRATQTVIPALKTPWPHYYLGIIHEEKGNYKEALRQFNTAIEVADTVKDPYPIPDEYIEQRDNCQEKLKKIRGH